MDLTGIPLRVKGKAEITDENGDVNETEGKMVALCRCGQSANKPFCLQEDGDFVWRVSDCEELVGVTYRGMMLKENCQRERSYYWENVTPLR